MSESKTEYVVEYRRRGTKHWQRDKDAAFTARTAADKKYDSDAERFPSLQHRLIRVTVLKESK